LALRLSEGLDLARGGDNSAFFILGTAVRLVYFDEAGIGSSSEPYVVVAGVLVDADKQWRAVERHLRDLVLRYILPQDRSGFIFHAKDIHHGTHKTHRDRYERALRIDLLRELCLIPDRFNLPIVAGYVERAVYASHHPDLSVAEQTVNAQAIAAISCTCAVEKALRGEGSSDEVAVLVYENNDSARRTIKECHNFLNTPQALADAAASGWALQAVLPFTRILDTAHFANKDEAPILQVADAVAFAIARQLTGRDREDYAQPIGQNLIMRLRSFASGAG